MQQMPFKATTSPVQPQMVTPTQVYQQQPQGPTMAEQALSAPSEMSAQNRAPAVGVTEVNKAFATWRKYKEGKQALNDRVEANEKWWRMRHSENPIDPANADQNSIKKSSAWLVNSLLNKHADAIDNYPEASILPREQSDEEAAKILSEVLPVLLAQNKFESVWSDSWWRKVKFGAAIYGVYWNGQKMNGVGDLDIKSIDLLNLYWEPGIKDIQDSANIFHVAYWDNRELELAYPELVGKLGSNNELPEHQRDNDTVDIMNRTMVFDWYYKGVVERMGPDGNTIKKNVVHLCKFVNSNVLFSSENDAESFPDGFYAHGKYPFVVDNLFPIETDIVGFGYLDIMKSAQEHIDALGADIAKNIRARAKMRWLVPNGASINDAEWADFTKPFVTYNGTLDNSKYIEIKPDPVGGDVINWYDKLINELKETSGNQDVNTGAKPSGITAASAIAALQEAGSKLSRDMLKASYRSTAEIYEMSIEIIRQFYGVGRYFRIVAPEGTQYQMLDNSMLAMNPVDGRMPYFDIDIKPQKSNPYSKVAQNEFAFELFNRGFFNPQMADSALACVDMMDFDGKEDVRQRISQNGTMLQAIQRVVGLMQNLPPDIGMLLMGALGPQVTALMPQQAAPAQGGDKKQTRLDSLGAIQPASDIAGRVKEQVASRSDPNGGKV